MPSTPGQLSYIVTSHGRAYNAQIDVNPWAPWMIDDRPSRINCWSVLQIYYTYLILVLLRYVRDIQD